MVENLMCFSYLYFSSEKSNPTWPVARDYNSYAKYWQGTSLLIPVLGINLK